MAAAQVSLLMPTFNSLALRNARTGTPLIEEAMASLLQQTHRDLALVILDNQSTDGTVEYCRTRAAADARITVHVDSERRGPEEAIKALTELHNSPLCMIVNDDDVWDPHYIARLHALQQAEASDLAYCAGSFVSMSGRPQGPITADPRAVYTNAREPLANYEAYLAFRNPFPISFGIWRAELLHDLYPAVRFNEFRDNMDNLFIANVLRSGARVSYLDEELFAYRNKPRRFSLPEVSTPGADDADTASLFVRLLVHELAFANQLVTQGHAADRRAADSEPRPALLWDLAVLRSARAAAERVWMGTLLTKRATRAQHRALLAFRTACLMPDGAPPQPDDAGAQMSSQRAWLAALADGAAALPIASTLRDRLQSTTDELRTNAVHA
ncbi:MAG: glycosyltransferase family A protein [Candidatus Nanopelagicales bacterium]|nr:glycosyltransferase family A protein [Candidatus Nanopelagicales bacterium]